MHGATMKIIPGNLSFTGRLNYPSTLGQAYKKIGCNQSQAAKREKKKVQVAVHGLDAGKVRALKCINVEFCKVWISRIHE